MNKMLLSFVLGIICCTGQRTEILETHESPSGQYSLIVELGNRDNERDWTILMFKLIDRNAGEVDYVRTGASDAQKWAVSWYNEKTIVLNSSDIGTLAWTILEKGRMSEIWPVTEDMVKKGKEAYNKKYSR